MAGVNGNAAGMSVDAPTPVVTVVEATEVTPQPSITQEHHSRPKRTPKGSTDMVLRQGDERLEEWRFMPVMSIDKALERRRIIVDATKQLMHEGVDYGKIPGTESGGKPGRDVLLQPGADKLCNLFGLVIRYEVTKCIEDWTGVDHDGVPFFFYETKGRAYRQIGETEYLMGEGMGSCNAWESKYRWRNAERICPSCSKPNIRKSRDAGWYCWAKTGGCGATFKDGDQRIEGQAMGRKVNSDLADVVNTVLKMALKRAKVSTTINATSASEFFTQDVEENPGTATEDPDPRGLAVDIGQNRHGTKEAQEYVRDKNLTEVRTAAKPPAPAPRPAVVSQMPPPAKPWTNRGEMRRVFANLREIVGESAYLAELQEAGVRDPSEFRNGEKAEACYARLLALADKEAA